MATSKPRITITLEPRTYEVLSRMSKAGNESMSQIVTGLVDLAVPSLERVVAVIERAATASDEVKDGMRAALDRADRAIIPQLIDAAQQGDMFLAGLAAEGEAAQQAPGPAVPAQAPAQQPKRGRKVVPAEGSTPVPVTRGSGAVAGGTRKVGAAPPKGGSGQAVPGLVSVPTSGTHPRKGVSRGKV